MRKRESATSHQALQRRLETLTDQYSLSEISRRTGAPLASVSRYFRGTRVPADFCGELTLHFGVNPAWLLTGEGMPWVSDITAGTSAMAGDLLELVEAMNAVTHMRLGALTGKHHLRVLRELNDAMVRFDDLRRRMNEHARPVFERLLQDLEKALARLDIDRAADLRTAVEQVARLCDDETLEYRHSRVRAHHELVLRNSQEALRHQQRAFRHVFTEGQLSSDRDCNEVIRLAMALVEAGHEDKALRVCKAARELAGEEGHEWEGFAFLSFLTGQLMTLRLQLFEGIELMQRWLPKVKSEGRAHAGRHVLTHAMMQAGLVRPEEAIDMPPDSEVKAINLLYFAMFREDPDLLQRALDYLEGGRVKRRRELAIVQYLADSAHLLLDVLSGRKSGTEARLRKLKSAGDDDKRGVVPIELAVFEAQLLRHLGKRAKAAKVFRVAAEAITEPPRPVRVLLLVRATHHRNGLVLGNEDERRESEDFFGAHERAGYKAFAL